MILIPKPNGFFLNIELEVISKMNLFVFEFLCLDMENYEK